VAAELRLGSSTELQLVGIRKFPINCPHLTA